MSMFLWMNKFNFKKHTKAQSEIIILQGTGEC